MQELSSVTERMRRDWNQRAREDANFYVAFGRRDQPAEEFFATASDVVRSLDRELRRLRPRADRAWRALEIGCGPGRLIKPMSRRFGEIHGVDVSDEMIARARSNLADLPNAHVHHTQGSDLAEFASETFDFVYSYAVFQHIPSREVVFSYLRESCRVLRPGGIIRVQINGLDATAKEYDTWGGVRIDAREVRRFALEQRMQLLALEGARTQYMWVTLRKPHALGPYRPAREPLIRRVTNAESSEPVVPAAGRFAALSLWVEELPPNADLNSLELLTENTPATITYIGPPEWDGLQQVNAILGSVERTGVLTIQLRQHGAALCPPSAVRVVPAPPPIPAVISIADGVDLLSGSRIVSGTVKVIVEEVLNPGEFTATVAGQPVTNIDLFCSDPLPPRHEINFNLPPNLPPGAHLLEMRCGARWLGAAELLADVPPRAEG
jgi:SAM-dependent methyltransferase